MSGILVLFAKSLLIAFAAAVAACLPWVLVIGGDAVSSIRFLAVAAMGSFAVGLPIALLTYYLAGEQLRQSAGTVFMIANMAGVMLLLVTILLGQVFGGFVFGVPSLIAANVYAVLGWFWILKPQREAQNA